VSEHAAERPALTPEARSAAARLTLWYFGASTAIFFVSGLLGVLLRDSQADLGRFGDNFWYAVMTAHGLGAFVGWAGFAVMGFAWWVLASLGFEIRTAGLYLGWFSFWCMIFGVFGVVVTTLIFDFAASWVFLYPLPFGSAGQWSDWTTALFSFSVLLAGLSIITWCMGLIHTMLGPALHAKSANVFNRFGVALGFGYLWPRRFATNPKSVPYPVIPLAVIGIDMIVATLPLAVLLVFFIYEAAAPGFSFDVLGAKNILWFFGHPVVYLLLFPAAAIYYHLIPRYAGRPLVAGNVIAIAWAIAVIANVIVWAHHIYLDYPQGTLQAALNTAMQPTTFALTIPSALSLYSLGFTIYRSNFRWTAASTALFLGLIGWLTAGLSGVVNATIAFDQIVHNTLWIVGHFHHMALFNIGFVIFGAAYAYLPELTGNRLWSERVAKTHVWITFAAGMGFVTVWLVEGLDGAPRRFSILPGEYDAYQVASLPFIFILALAQLLFAANVVQTIRGAAGRVDEAEAARPAKRKRKRPAATAEALYVLVAVALAFAAGAAGWAIGNSQGGGGGAPPAATTTGEAPATETEPGATETAPAGEGDAAAGAAVFSEAGCGSCHTLSAAGTSGQIGPNLDETQLSAAQIAETVANGTSAGMPSFSSQLDEQQIQDVAAYVAEAAGG
jgi:cytochrome c oxidase subunit 1